MTSAAVVSLRNWGKYQHYKHRRPPWVRLYVDMLDDPEMMRLPDASFALACKLILLAGRYDNAIPLDRIKWHLHRFSSSSMETLQSIGFIAVTEPASTALALRLRDATTETETEVTESETETETTYSCADAHTFDDFWKAWPKGKRVGKKQAVAQWNRIKPDAATFAAMVDAIGSLNGDMQYVKHPHRWLRDKNWEDAKPAKPSAVLVTASDREHGQAARVAIAKARERDE